VKDALEQIKSYFMSQSPCLDSTDGLSMVFEGWRFNLRGSNTEPLLRLNVESRGDATLVQQKVDEISHLISNS
jgi:phosphomannomutase/phosphoglucomutase